MRHESLRRKTLMQKSNDGIAIFDHEHRIIEANEFEGLTFDELSRRWEIPLGTLLARKSRAIKRLSAAMSEHAPHN